MKKIILFLGVLLAVVSCKNSPANKANVTLEELDDYFSVESFSLVTNAKEKGLENLESVTGTLTLVVKRNKVEMALKPSDIDWAVVYGETPSYRVFRGECDAVVRQMLKLDLGTKETFTIGIESTYSDSSWDEEAEKAKKKQDMFTALTSGENMTQIKLSIEKKEDASTAAINALKDIVETLEDDEFDDE